MLGSYTLLNDPIPLLLLGSFRPLLETRRGAMIYARVHQADWNTHLKEMEDSQVVRVNLCPVSQELEVRYELIYISFLHF